MGTQEVKLYSNNRLIRNVKLSSGDEFFIMCLEKEMNDIENEINE